MTTYYVRKNGSDAAAGTSAGAAWLTVNKVLTTIASGDTTYVGAGIYREAVTVTVTPTVETKIIGDVFGQYTGDAGEVRLTGMNTVGDLSSNNSVRPLNHNSKNFLTFENFVFVSGQTQTCLASLGTNNTFTNCAFFSSNGTVTVLSGTLAVDVAQHWLFDRCIFGSFGALSIVLPTSTVADYDVDIVFRNCLNASSANAMVTVSGSGGNSFKGGGVDIRSCSSLWGPLIVVGGALLSTTIPCTVYDSYGFGNTPIQGGTLVGQIIEDYNVLNSETPRSNVTAGVHSCGGSRLSGGHFHVGQERIWGGLPQPLGTPVRDDPLILGYGTAGIGNPSTDILGRRKPDGVGRLVASGTATAGAATTLTDSGATWLTNLFQGAVCRITGGTGSGQSRTIKSNTATALTFYSNWPTNPDNTSTYVIYWGTPAERGQATSGAATTLTVSSATWSVDCWSGFTIEIVSGTGSGQTRTITSNTGSVITVPTWTTNPDSTSVFKIYRQTSETALLPAVGCYERHDTALKETTTTDAGSVGIRLEGWSSHRFRVPVNAASTTVSIKARYDANHATTTKPQAVLIADGELGVATETKTMTSAVDTWETLTFTAFTPTAKGWVDVELQSRAAVPWGRAFFDTVVVT